MQFERMLLLRLSAVTGPRFLLVIFFPLSKFCLQYLIISGEMSHMLKIEYCDVRLQVRTVSSFML